MRQLFWVTCLFYKQLIVVQRTITSPSLKTPLLGMLRHFGEICQPDMTKNSCIWKPHQFYVNTSRQRCCHRYMTTGTDKLGKRQPYYIEKLVKTMAPHFTNWIKMLKTHLFGRLMAWVIEMVWASKLEVVKRLKRFCEKTTGASCLTCQVVICIFRTMIAHFLENKRITQLHEVKTSKTLTSISSKI